ncbi:hypothetical protein IEQ34_020168 [Dendrobium chrysotoxum]|uniref:Uncharacterized protein n=1 Tax=Dendrobium chrysotoxum TaxID=161865 RepID=A0AAV7FZG4_DENCH|nr:hypothetical protein IEQ34_020168 [Dendrobium chrysotoxum]
MAESLADMILGFFEEEWAAGSSGSDDGWISAGEGDGAESGGGAAEARAFWESQDQLLQEALMRTGSAETRIRGNVEEAVRKLMAEGATLCDFSGGGFAAAASAGGGGSEGSRGYVLRGIAERLREKGYDSAVCRSKWQRSPDIPSGEHSYVDVLIGSRSGLKDPTRIVIEPNFKAEFEMARASPEYNSLVARLPEIFVGKTEKLKSVVKIMCRAAKRCLKENKMHMAPWRKQEYMLSKWFHTCERLSPPTPAAAAARDAIGGAPRQPRPRASLLTFDLRRTAVKVV